jgi:hypothetical protein
VAAVAREANHVDVFATGANGSISCISWNAASGWGSWLDLAGRTAAVGSASTAVARDQNHVDLFMTGADSVVHCITWDASRNSWGNWVDLDGTTVLQGYPINVTVLDSDHLVLTACTGIRNRVLLMQVNRWDAAVGWRGWTPIG